MNTAGMIERLRKWMQEGNDCGKCPCYWFEQGYEDCDEGCRINLDGIFYGGCRLPRIVRWYRNRQAVFFENHQFDGIEDWWEEQERLDNVIAEGIKKGLDGLVICSRYIDKEEKHLWEVEQEECIYRLAHSLNSTLSDDKFAQGTRTLKAKWAELLKETWENFCFRVRAIITV